MKPISGPWKCSVRVLRSISQATHRSMRGYLSLATVDANSTQTHIEHTIDREPSQRFPSTLITRMHFVVSQGFVPKIGPEPSPNGGACICLLCPFSWWSRCHNAARPMAPSRTNANRRDPFILEFVRNKYLYGSPSLSPKLHAMSMTTYTKCDCTTRCPSSSPIQTIPCVTHHSLLVAVVNNEPRPSPWPSPGSCLGNGQLIILVLSPLTNCRFLSKCLRTLAGAG